MSIIYDALQKTQYTREGKRKILAAVSDRRWMLLSIGLSLTVFLLLFIAYFPQHNSSSHKASATKVVGKSANRLPNKMAKALQKPIPHVVKPSEPAQAALPITPVLSTAENQPSQPSMTPITPTTQTSQPPVTNTAPMPPINFDMGYNNNFTLNGVMLSNLDKIAMINNQAYHLGDIVNGMKVVNIDANSVTLQDGQRTVILR